MNAPVQRAETTALTNPADQPIYRASVPTGRDLILAADNLNAIVRVAELMAKAGKMVPQHLRNNPGGCLAVTMQAMRWNMDPFALGLKTFEVNDLVGYEAQAIISALNNSPLLTTRLSWKWEGTWERIVGKFVWKESKKKQDEHGEAKKYLSPTWDDKDEDGLSVTVSATLAGEAEPRQLTLLMKQARVRNSPLWTEDPKQQLAYLAAKRWGRLHAPDVIMGVYTPDELEERDPKYMGPADVVQTTIPPELLKAARAAADKGRAAFSDWWAKALPPERGLLTGELADLKKRVDAFEAGRTVDNQAGAGNTTSAPASAATPAADAPATTAASTPPQAATGAFAATYANVLEKMLKATEKKDQDALDIAADWIGEVQDQEQRAELNKKYEELKAEIAAGTSK